MKFPAVTFIGLGRLGSAMVRAFAASGIPFKSLYNRSEGRAESLAKELQVERFGSFPESPTDLGDVTFITVNDDNIAEIAERLAKFEADFDNRTFVHCSGNESADLLNPLRKKGASVVTFHPLQTFSKNVNLSDFRGIYFSVQGDQSAISLLKSVADKLEAHVLEVNADQKSHLHISAVIASNYLNSLLASAVETTSLSNLSPDKVKAALLPLVKTSLRNIENSSFEESLTGPIKRGDIKTIEKHLNMLRDQPLLLNIYCSLGHQTLKTASSDRSLSQDKILKISNLLSPQR